MTPTCALIITKTRELLAATPDATLARVYTLALDAGVQSAAGPVIIEQLSALREHVGKMPSDEIAKEFRSSIDAIIAMGDERIIVEHCKYVTRGILECANSVS